MQIVPLEKDRITLTSGIVQTVISYSPYKEDGIGVYTADDEFVLFSDIREINKSAVTLQKNIFNSVGKVKRKIHLPQIGDVVSFEFSGGTESGTVKGLKILKKKPFKGIIFDVIVDEEKVEVSIPQIIKIERLDGGDLVSILAFHNAYKEYGGKTGVKDE